MTDELTLTLQRTDFSEHGIFGELSISGYDLCTTLEHSYDGLPKLPAGTYTCRRGDHLLKSGPIETFEVLNVPNHYGILFHHGNFNSDSDGCILLGADRTPNMLVHSRDAFGYFMDCLLDVDVFQLEVL